MLTLIPVMVFDDALSRLICESLNNCPVINDSGIYRQSRDEIVSWLESANYNARQPVIPTEYRPLLRQLTESEFRSADATTQALREIPAMLASWDYHALPSLAA